MTLVKPGPWAITPGSVPPSEQWAWRGLRAAIPLYDSGRSSIYSVGTERVVGGLVSGFPSFATGPHGRHILCVASGYADLGNVLSITGDCTISVLARLTTTGGYYTVCAKRADGSGSEWLINVQTTGNLQGGFLDGAFSYQVVPATFSSVWAVNRWALITYTRKRPINRLYVDGKLVATASLDFGVATSGVNANLGAYNGGNEAWTGEIAFFGAWERALTPAEVARLAVDPFAPFRRDISGYPRTTAKRRLKYMGRR